MAALQQSVCGRIPGKTGFALAISSPTNVAVRRVLPRQSAVLRGTKLVFTAPQPSRLSASRHVCNASQQSPFQHTKAPSGFSQTAAFVAALAFVGVSGFVGNLLGRRVAPDTLKTAGQAAGATVGVVAGVAVVKSQQGKGADVAVAELQNVLASKADPASLTAYEVAAIGARSGVDLPRARTEDLKNIYATYVKSLAAQGGAGSQGDKIRAFQTALGLTDAQVASVNQSAGVGRDAQRPAASSSTPVKAAFVDNGAPTAKAVHTFRELKKGNERFVQGETALCKADPPLVAKLSGGQAPPAAVISCADSRVPPELVFDQEIGEVFVTRVAGNVTSPHVTGSLLFAVENLQSRLIVVLGHTACGAVKASIGAHAGGAGTHAVDCACCGHATLPDDQHPVLTVVDSILPAVRSVSERRKAKKPLPANLKALFKEMGVSTDTAAGKIDDAQGCLEVVAENVVNMTHNVRGALKQHLKPDLHAQVEVKAAVYDLKDGKVHYFDA